MIRMILSAKRIFTIISWSKINYNEPALMWTISRITWMLQLLLATEKKNQRSHILNIFIPRPNNPYFFLEERIKLLNDCKFSSLCLLIWRDSLKNVNWEITKLCGAYLQLRIFFSDHLIGISFIPFQLIFYPASS